ncbi:hypothetical protein Pcinc_011805 [Petrolisthes cinctipes]|uniref:Uncharacterized protein n=1 Tax=Petrolisthes cinctipes TaxID=88211 RepID=A0AAE1G054_PETCI|nr:hypothetical protein Pcinc_011805 [Petrolisthes cinctipes]
MLTETCSATEWASGIQRRRGLIPHLTTTRPQDHPIVQDLLGRLQRRLTPLQWLTNNSLGISIPEARTIYIAFIRSVVDYLSPALIQLPRATPET